MATDEMKYINGINEIARLQKKAVKANYNRCFTNMENFINAVCTATGKSSPEIWNYKFPIVNSLTMPHNDSEMRTHFVIGGKQLASLDMSFEDYEALPSIRYENEILTTIH
tara:strand:+ start:3530 stop:3862 length:333 start_codon:yes stop_codon:yes gene_type:complete